MADGDILIATTSALIPFEGREVCIAGGRTTVRQGHPILEGREALFRVLVPDYELEEPAKPPEPPAKPPAPKKPAAPPAAQTGPAAGAAGPPAAKDGTAARPGSAA